MNILVLGPSCVGKTTLINLLVDLGYRGVKSYTTRPPRENEDGYMFITDEEFNKIDDFVDKSFHLGYQYGIRKSDLGGDNLVFNTNLLGIDNLKRYADEVIVLLPVIKNEMVNRILMKRSNSKERVLIAEQEIEFYKNNNVGKVFYISVVDDLVKLSKKYI
jgi:guanylate kinase